MREELIITDDNVIKDNSADKLSQKSEAIVSIEALIDNILFYLEKRHYHLAFPCLFILMQTLEPGKLGEEDQYSLLSDAHKQMLEVLFDQYFYDVDDFFKLLVIRDYLCNLRECYLLLIGIPREQHRKYYYTRKWLEPINPVCARHTNENLSPLYTVEKIKQVYTQHGALATDLIPKLKDELNHLSKSSIEGKRAIALIFSKNVLCYLHTCQILESVTFELAPQSFPYLPQAKVTAPHSVMTLPFALHALIDNLLSLTLTFEVKDMHAKEYWRELASYLEWLHCFSWTLEKITLPLCPEEKKIDVLWPASSRTPLGSVLTLSQIGKWFMQANPQEALALLDVTCGILKTDVANLQPAQAPVLADYEADLNVIRQNFVSHCQTANDYAISVVDYNKNARALFRKISAATHDLLGFPRVEMTSLLYGSYSRGQGSIASDVEENIAYEARVEESKTTQILDAVYVLSHFKAFELVTMTIDGVDDGLRLDPSTYAAKNPALSESALDKPAKNESIFENIELTVDALYGEGILPFEKLFQKKVQSMANQTLMEMIIDPTFLGITSSPVALNEHNALLASWKEKVKTVFDKKITTEQLTPAILGYFKEPLPPVNEEGTLRQMFGWFMYLDILVNAKDQIKSTIWFDSERRADPGLRKEMDLKNTFYKPLSYFPIHLSVVMEIPVYEPDEILRQAKEQHLIPDIMVKILLRLIHEICFLRERQYQTIWKRSGQVRQIERFLTAPIEEQPMPGAEDAKQSADPYLEPLTEKEQRLLRCIHQAWIEPLKDAMQSLIEDALKGLLPNKEALRARYYRMSETLCYAFLNKIKAFYVEEKIRERQSSAITLVGDEHCDDLLAFLTAFPSPSHSQIAEYEQKRMAKEVHHYLCDVKLFPILMDPVRIQGFFENRIGVMHLPQIIADDFQKKQEKETYLITDNSIEKNTLFFHFFPGSDEGRTAILNVMAYQQLFRQLGWETFFVGLPLRVEIDPFKEPQVRWLWVEQRTQGGSLTTSLSETAVTQWLLLQALGIMGQTQEDYRVIDDKLVFAPQDYHCMSANPLMGVRFNEALLEKKIDWVLLRVLLNLDVDAFFVQWETALRSAFQGCDNHLFQNTWYPPVWSALKERMSTLVNCLNHASQWVDYQTMTFTAREFLLIFYPEWLRPDFDDSQLNSGLLYRQGWLEKNSAADLWDWIAQHAPPLPKELFALSYAVVEPALHPLYLRLLKRIPSDSAVQPLTLNLSYHQTVTSADAIELLNKFKQVREMNLSHCPLMDDRIITLLAEGSYPALTVLRCDDNPGIKRVVWPKNKPPSSLARLSLRRCLQLQGIDVHNLPSLRQLAIAGSTALKTIQPLQIYLNYWLTQAEKKLSLVAPTVGSVEILMQECLAFQAVMHSSSSPISSSKKNKQVQQKNIAAKIDALEKKLENLRATQKLVQNMRSASYSMGSVKNKTDEVEQEEIEVDSYLPRVKTPYLSLNQFTFPPDGDASCFLSEGDYGFEIFRDALLRAANRSQLLRVIFHSETQMHSFETYFTHLIQWTENLNVSALFVATEPENENQFILGIVDKRKVWLMHPLGERGKSAFITSLTDLHQAGWIEQVYFTQQALHASEQESIQEEPKAEPQSSLSEQPSVQVNEAKVPLEQDPRFSGLEGQALRHDLLARGILVEKDKMLQWINDDGKTVAQERIFIRLQGVAESLEKKICPFIDENIPELSIAHEGSHWRYFTKNILTLGDGNCLYNAIALGLCDGVASGAILTLSQDFFECAGVFNLFESLDEFKQWIKHRDDEEQQRKLSPLLRSMAIDWIQENIEDYQDTFRVRLRYVYKAYRKDATFRDDDKFLAHDFILQQLQNEALTEEEFIQWWEREKGGRDAYFNTLRKPADGTNDEAHWGAEIEADALASCLALNIVWHKANGTQTLGIENGVIPLFDETTQEDRFTKEEQVILKELGLGYFRKRVFQISCSIAQQLKIFTPFADKTSLVLDLLASHPNIEQADEVTVNNPQASSGPVVLEMALHLLGLTSAELQTALLTCLPEKQNESLEEWMTPCDVASLLPKELQRLEDCLTRREFAEYYRLLEQRRRHHYEGLVDFLAKETMRTPSVSQILFEWSVGKGSLSELEFHRDYPALTKELPIVLSEEQRTFAHVWSIPSRFHPYASLTPVEQVSVEIVLEAMAAKDSVLLEEMCHLLLGELPFGLPAFFYTHVNKEGDVLKAWIFRQRQLVERWLQENPDMLGLDQLKLTLFAEEKVYRKKLKRATAHYIRHPIFDGKKSEGRSNEFQALAEKLLNRNALDIKENETESGIKEKWSQLQRQYELRQKEYQTYGYPFYRQTVLEILVCAWLYERRLFLYKKHIAPRNASLLNSVRALNPDVAKGLLKCQLDPKSTDKNGVLLGIRALLLGERALALFEAQGMFLWAIADYFLGQRKWHWLPFLVEDEKEWDDQEAAVWREMETLHHRYEKLERACAVRSAQHEFLLESKEQFFWSRLKDLQQQAVKCHSKLEAAMDETFATKERYYWGGQLISKRRSPQQWEKAKAHQKATLQQELSENYEISVLFGLLFDLTINDLEQFLEKASTEKVRLAQQMEPFRARLKEILHQRMEHREAKKKWIVKHALELVESPYFQEAEVSVEKWVEGLMYLRLPLAREDERGKLLADFPMQYEPHRSAEQTVLHTLVLEGQWNELFFLLRQGVQSQAKNKEGKTFFEMKDPSGNTVLHQLVLQRQWSLLYTVLPQAPKDTLFLPNKKNKTIFELMDERGSSLLYRIIEDEKQDFIEKKLPVRGLAKYLICAGAKITERNQPQEFETPLTLLLRYSSDPETLLAFKVKCDEILNWLDAQAISGVKEALKKAGYESKLFQVDFKNECTDIILAHKSNRIDIRHETALYLAELQQLLRGLKAKSQKPGKPAGNSAGGIMVLLNSGGRAGINKIKALEEYLIDFQRSLASAILSNNYSSLLAFVTYYKNKKEDKKTDVLKIKVGTEEPEDIQKRLELVLEVAKTSEVSQNLFPIGYWKDGNQRKKGPIDSKIEEERRKRKEIEEKYERLKNGFNVFLMYADTQETLSDVDLQVMSETYGHAPLLIKARDTNQCIIFGCVDKKWQKTELSEEENGVLKDLLCEQEGLNRLIDREDPLLSSAVFNTLKKGHIKVNLSSGEPEETLKSGYRRS